LVSLQLNLVSVFQPTWHSSITAGHVRDRLFASAGPVVTLEQSPWRRHIAASVST